MRPGLIPPLDPCFGIRFARGHQGVNGKIARILAECLRGVRQSQALSRNKGGRTRVNLVPWTTDMEGKIDPSKRYMVANGLDHIAFLRA